MRQQWMGYFEKLKGYDDEVTHEFSMVLNQQREDSGTTIVKGLPIHLDTNFVSIVTTTPLGVQRGKEDRKINATTKKNFFLLEEENVEDKNGVRRESLHYPWDEVAYNILKYISCERRLRIVYAYQFRLLYELRFQTKLSILGRFSVPHFLFQSILEMSERLREWKNQHSAHHGLIKLIVMNCLSHLKIPVLCPDFVDMDMEVFIETKALTSIKQEEIPKYSARGIKIRRMRT